MSTMGYTTPELATTHGRLGGSGWDRAVAVRLPDGSWGLRGLRGPVGAPEWDVVVGRRGRVLADGHTAVRAMVESA